MNTPVSFELAKLLREKRFNEQTLSIYHDGEIMLLKSTISNREFMTSRDYSAPTISEVVTWLYNVHGIWIWVACRQLDNESNKIIFIPNGRFIPTQTKNGFEVDCIPYLPKSEPNEAYEAAIKYTLENIIK